MSDFNILVTGSSGHLGTALMLALPALGFHPLGLDILASPNTNIVGSITDRELVGSIFKDHPIKHVLHTATLHKPHICSHTKEQFVETNMTGTLVLLEEAARHVGPKLESFIFFSTTSTFGAALSPKPGSPAAWIDETVHPIPKNIYGVTKLAAEDMCLAVHKSSDIPVLVLRTSRFFPEEDDDEDRRTAMQDDNLKVLELAYRRCDLADIVDATLCAMRKAQQLRWGKFIISAPPPFPKDPETLAALDSNPAEVFQRVSPATAPVFSQLGWKHLARLDRVYDSSKAVKELEWEPKFTFDKTLERLRNGQEWRSPLSIEVGKKGYHAVSTGVYTKR